MKITLDVNSREELDYIFDELFDAFLMEPFYGDVKKRQVLMRATDQLREQSVALWPLEPIVAERE